MRSFGRRATLASLTGLLAVGGVSTAVTAFGGADADADTITRMTVGVPGPRPYSPAAGTDRVSDAQRIPDASQHKTAPGKVTTPPPPGPAGPGDSTGSDGPLGSAHPNGSVGTNNSSGSAGSPASTGSNGSSISGGATGSTGTHSAPCDPGRLAANLQADPAKAQAWANAHGIGTQEIPGYLSGLTPTYLKSDTLVMNHSYKDGKDASNPAVLQAGMGVLVNASGVPVVKCNCGNPLTPPGKGLDTKDAVYTGPKWTGWSEKRVVKVVGEEQGVRPGRPGSPMKPEPPASPPKPVHPRYPKPPAQEMPWHPEHPVQPRPPAHPENPKQPGGPEKPVRPERPAQPGQPGQPDEPVQPQKPVQPDLGGGSAPMAPADPATGGAGQAGGE